MNIRTEIDGDSEEAVAFALLQLVARAEGKTDFSGDIRGVDREWLLDTYAECLATVNGDRGLILMADDDEDEGDEEEDNDAEDADAEDEEDDKPAA